MTLFVARAACWIVLSLAALTPARAQTIPSAEYRERRAELRKSLDGVLVLMGAADPSDLHDTFYQEPNFAYLTGWQEPGAALLLTPKDEILFLPPRVANRETYNGRTTGPDEKDAPQKAGFDKVLPRAQMEAQFVRAMESAEVVYALGGDAQSRDLARLAPLHDRRDAADLITRLRLRKSATEIGLIRKATDATVAAHRAAWKQIKPGLFEYQIESTMLSTYLELGCERSAYAPIVASGPNGVVLHYSANRRRIESGDLVLMDVGGEYAGYAADVTRTVPVNGKFTPRQREIYDIVLAAQKAAIAAVKPGMTLLGDSSTSLRKIAMDYINTHGKDLHGAPLGKYFVHGLGHFVGLEVHDPGSFDTGLEPGMVITIEPGVYLPEENLGIRIEDTLLVTATGAEVLSSALPKEAEEIEKLLGK
ncbi:MAG: aminopeptidase P N-terminal domain-containing protein [Acidobacteriota bacterium]